MKRNFFLLTLVIFVFSILVACTEKGEPANEGQPDVNDDKEVKEVKQFSKEDAIVKVATPWGEDHFMERVGDYVEEHNPHITLEHIGWDGTVENLEELYAGGITPDVFLAFTGQQPLEELESVQPLDDMIEDYGVDLSKIQTEVIDEIRSRDAEQRLVGIPQEIGLLGLYYNKEIFDMLGVDPPDPNVSMSWEEMMELARKMTVEQNGVSYCGLVFENQKEVPLWELATNMTDPETGKVLFTSEPKFSKYMELMDEYYNIPGISNEDCSFGEKTAAMLISWHGFMANGWMGGETTEEAIEVMKHIDIAPVPTWSDAPNIGPSPRGVHPWVINAHSENQEAALEFVLAGIEEDYQLVLAKAGTPSALNIPAVSEQYGADNELFVGKNIDAFFATTPAAPPEVQSVWDQFSGGLDLDEFAESNMDYQEFLRVSEEKAQIKVEDAKSAQ